MAGPRGLCADNEIALPLGPSQAAIVLPPVTPASLREHPHPHGRAGRAARARPRPDVHLRPDRLPLRPRRQPAQQPAGRPHPADAALPRHRRLPRQEHHRRRPPARRALRPRRGPDARPGRPRAQDAGRDRRRVRGGVPRRRGRWSTSCPRTSSRGRPSTSPRCSTLAEALEDAGLRLRDAGAATSTTRSASFAGLRPAVGQHARRPARRPSRRGRAGQARPGRLRAVEGRRRGPPPQVADRRAGARAIPGWHLECSAMAHALPRRPRSTSTPAASTTSSRTTRTRSPSRRRSSAASRRATGSTASSC